MSKILDMRNKRGEVWDRAKAFLDAHTSETGLMSAEDTAAYERMEQEVVDLGRAIEREERALELERELNASVSPDLASRPEQRRETKKGVASDAYGDAFWKHMRDQARRNAEVRNALQVGELSGVVPHFVEECYPAAVYQTCMEQTKLQMEIIPGIVRCKDCGAEFSGYQYNLKCPKCGSEHLDALSGREFIIKEIIAC